MRTSWRDLVGAAVAGDILSNGFQRVDADPGEAGKLELDLERRRVLLSGRDESMGHHADLPAARIILEAREPLDERALARAPVPARQRIDAAGDLPLRRQVHLLDALARELGAGRAALGAIRCDTTPSVPRQGGPPG